MMISIIVPIFNVEEYLCRCLDSILKQSYTEYELILVDDGSPDNCGDICEQYVQKDMRIQVIHKENGGLSDARNAGMKIAQGEYICFVDSDDWVAPDYLKNMLDALVENGGDICECNVIRTERDEIKPKDICLYEADNRSKVYSSEQAMRLLIEDIELHQHVWNKLFRRECVEGIMFPVGKTNEDEYWTYQVFGRANKVIKIPDVLYYYFQREGSIMREEYSLRRLDGLEAKEQRQNYIEKYFPQLKAVAGASLFESCIYSGQMSLKHLKGNERKESKQIIDRIRKDIRWNDIHCELKGKSRIWGRLAKLNFWGLCWLKNLFRKGW